MTRGRGFLVGAAVAVAAFVGVALHYATSDLPAQHACDLSYSHFWGSRSLAQATLWIDRVGARLRFGSDKAGLARHLIKRGYDACADWFDEIPYFEDALATVESMPNPDDRLLVDALEALAVKLTFQPPWTRKPHVAALLRRAIAIRQHAFPSERDDLISSKFMLAYVLAFECFSQSNSEIMAESRALNQELIAADPMQLDAWELLGDIAALAKNWPEAEHYYREFFQRRDEAHEMPPMEGYVWRSITAEKLAVVLGVQGRRKEADEWSRQAAALRDGQQGPRPGRNCGAVPLYPGDISPAGKLWPF